MYSEDIMTTTYSTTTIVRVVHLPTGLEVTCYEYNWKSKNKKKALELLKDKLTEYKMFK
jgi:protein subunit release factor A